MKAVVHIGLVVRMNPLLQRDLDNAYNIEEFDFRNYIYYVFATKPYTAAIYSNPSIWIMQL